MQCKLGHDVQLQQLNSDNKVHGVNMGPTGVLSAPDGPHVSPMDPAIRDGCFYR